MWPVGQRPQWVTCTLVCSYGERDATKRRPTGCAPVGSWTTAAAATVATPCGTRRRTGGPGSRRWRTPPDSRPNAATTDWPSTSTSVSSSGVSPATSCRYRRLSLDSFLFCFFLFRTTSANRPIVIVSWLFPPPKNSTVHLRNTRPLRLPIKSLRARKTCKNEQSRCLFWSNSSRVWSFKIE